MTDYIEKSKKMNDLLEDLKQRAIEEKQYHFAVLAREIQEHLVPILGNTICKGIQNDHYRKIEIDLPDEMIKILQDMNEQEEAVEELLNFMVETKAKKLKKNKSFWDQVRKTYVDPLNLGGGWKPMTIKTVEKKLVVKYFEDGLEGK